mmetsp:Transcript_6894/g.16021  ORF Transcript_6894/g.16021 Transcript_6894/m.16021 type:complete len:213 (+) Transcript_6894:1770-2408(+)
MMIRKAGIMMKKKRLRRRTPPTPTISTKPVARTITRTTTRTIATAASITTTSTRQTATFRILLHRRFMQNTASALMDSREAPVRPKSMLVTISAKMVVFVPLILSALKVLGTELCRMLVGQCSPQLVPQVHHYQAFAPVQKAIPVNSVNARLADLATAATVVLVSSYHQVKQPPLETTMFAIAPHQSWKRLSVLDAIATLLYTPLALGPTAR